MQVYIVVLSTQGSFNNESAIVLALDSFWCLKESDLYFELFHRDAGEELLLKVSTYWGLGHPQSQEGQS